MSKILTNAAASADQKPEVALIDIQHILTVLRRRWWIIAGIMFLITLLALVFLLRMTPIYKSSALLEVKQNERNLMEVSQVENIVADQEFLTTQIELLQSESLIEDTIETLNLLSDSFLVNVESDLLATQSRSERLNNVVINFKKHLTVTPVGRSRLIQVSFEHSDPKFAARIVNTLTENYIGNGLSRKFNATAFAREFLEGRLKTVRDSLEKAERELVSYATNNNIIVVNSEGAAASSDALDQAALKILNVELTRASVDRVEAEAIYQQSLKGGFTLALLNDAELSKLKTARLELQSEYQEKLAIFKPAFPEMIELQARIELYEKEIAQKSNNINLSSASALKDAYDLALVKERDLNARVEALKKSVISAREKGINYTILNRQVETERTQYEALLQRLKEVSVSDDLGSNLVEVVDSAKAAHSPFKPNRIQGLLLALLFSGVLGFGVAYIIELIDDYISSPDDVKNKLEQIVMGVIPVSKTPENIQADLVNPQSILSEAYASLRTNLQFSGADGGPRIIQISSTRSGEGKSVSSLGVALRFAGIGKRVLLIDADMRRPTFTLTQSGEISAGLSGLLTKKTDFESVIQKTGYDGLHLITSGSIVPNPSELLASERFEELLTWARKTYDYIIVDSPPVLGLADAPILGAMVDATLVVVDSANIRTPNIKSSIERLENSGTKILGIVLTKYKVQKHGYMDYYQYTYAGRPEKQSNLNNGKEDSSFKSKQKFELS